MKDLMILNLTQHPATPEQLAAGVFDPTPEQRAEIVALLTFDELPQKGEIEERADELALTALALLAARFRSLSHGEQERLMERGTVTYFAMIGGAPYLMPHLENEMVNKGVNPLYAFSTRESVEEVQADGSVKKTAVFRHKGFVAPTLGAEVIE
jgi:hypothetical protein